jgi:nitrate/TMAO reductase-like tetraheme cytochrome c subunit
MTAASTTGARSRERFGLILAVVFGLCAGSAGYTFYYARGASYLSNDPNACANCHVMQTHWTAGRNRAITRWRPATTVTRRTTSWAST